MTGSTDDSSDSKKDQAEPETKHRRRRFSSETANDLLFWAVHLLVVAISLGIMWIKVDALANAMREILLAEQKSNATLVAQAQSEQVATIQAQQAEHTRSLQLDAATKILDGVLRQVSDIQADIKATLVKTNEINQLVLAQSEATKTAALQSETAAKSAAGAAQNAAATAGSAAGAAYRAAATSSRTGNVVASKVVTTQDKRILDAKERALRAKQAQLSKTIRQVKKNGPTLIQQIFH